MKDTNMSNMNTTDFDPRNVEDVFSDLAEMKRMREREKLLEAALRALVGHDRAGIASYEYGRECVYCGFADLDHAPDCPIVLAREALGEGE